MAKGKGKGKGKGGEYEDQDPITLAAGCAICCCFFPTTLLVLGMISLFGMNDRIDRIELYNSDMLQWEKNRETFSSSVFRVNNVVMTNDDSQNGSYWPIRDTCDKKSDPGIGCRSAVASSYYIYVDSNNATDITISDSSHDIYSTKLPLETTDTYNYQHFSCITSDLNCIISKCNAIGGVWNTTHCIQHLFLNNICIRVRKVNSIYIQDLPPSITLPNNLQNIGCYYRNQYVPYYYSSTQTPIKIEVRHAYDPVVSADIHTFGCSTGSLENAVCFGPSWEEQIGSGNIFLTIGGILLLVYIFVVLCCIYVCKSKLTNHSAPSIAKFPKIESETESLETPMISTVSNKQSVPQVISTL
ncbi:hypothetical protein WA158_002322 [Blastocystis sp. Blastoise]